MNASRIALHPGALMRGFACATATLWASGCAGPATPLGAIWDLAPQSLLEEAPQPLYIEERSLGAHPSVAPQQPGQAPSRAVAGILSQWIPGRDPRIEFDPPRQVLHGPHTLRVIIEDPAGVQGGYDFRVRYHGHDVTRSFMMQARVSREQDGARLVVEVPSIRFSPAVEHLVEVGYANPDTARRASTRYGAPICRAFEGKAILSLDDFKPEPALLQAIESISRQMGFNPAFAAALIAQESAFNPQSVSLSRALGLTQVTPLAEQEVSGLFTRWPRYPGINSMPAPVLKALVMAGEVNARNEWRLNPDRSIRGGLAFAKMLADRWQDSDQFSRIRWTADASTGSAGGGSGAGSFLGGSFVGGSSGAFGDAEVARTRLILASYHSGYSRVAQAISRHGATWLTAPELKEARKYVNRIFSYCDAFERAAAADEGARRVPSLAPALPPVAPVAKPIHVPPSAVKRVLHENKT